MTEYKDKFIAFIDILGFKFLVDKGSNLDEIIKILKEFGNPAIRKTLEKHGPIVCPKSKYLQIDLDFNLTQISDCLIVSSEVSPAGVINLLHHCWGAQIKLLQNGFMCRGYITRGKIYHIDEPPYIIGPGYQRACLKEKVVSLFKNDADEEGTPFVEVDPLVSEYIDQCDDNCVKAMFDRYVNNDGNSKGLFVFKHSAISFLLSGSVFNLEQLKQSNKIFRSSLENNKEQIIAKIDMKKEDAIQKGKHYIDFLNDQIAATHQVDKIIDYLSMDENRHYYCKIGNKKATASSPIMDTKQCLIK